MNIRKRNGKFAPRWLSLMLVSLLITGPANDAAASEEEDDDEFAARAAFKGPIPSPRNQPPRYPRGAALQQEEGWVIVSYVVTREGKVSDAVIEDSSGNPAFEVAALNALVDWRYQPATVAGEPVESTATKSMFRFESGTPGAAARAEFITRYRVVESALLDGALEGLEQQIASLRQQGTQNLYEDAWFWWLDYRYAIAIGDHKRARTAIARALASNDIYLPPDYFVAAIKAGYDLAIEDFNIQQALRYVDSLRSSTAAQASPLYPRLLAELDAHATRLKLLVESQGVFAIPGEIGEDGYWLHDLVRHRFTLNDIRGSVDEVGIRCQSWKSRRLEYQRDVEWSLPRDWQDCSAFIRGKPGTTLKLLELPQTVGLSTPTSY